MWTKYLWLFFTGLFLKFHVTVSDEDCFVTQKPKIQIIFVQDQVLKFNGDNWVKALSESVSHLIDLFKQNNFEAEYAVSGFVNYPDTAGPRDITNPEVCYFLIQELTTDKDKVTAGITKDVFPNRFNNHTNAGGPGTESVTTAMLFSAVDKRLKWNSGFYDSRGNLVRKFMIPIVYKGYAKFLLNPGDRKPPKADGTDTCATALIPEIEQLNQVLWDHQFSVITSILKFSFYPVNVEKLYAELFSSLLVPYYQHPVGKGGGNVPPLANFSTTGYAKNLYDLILREAMSCDWEDPVGYNSLGL